MKKLFHNTTSKYNGYWNAQEIMKMTMLEMKDMQANNYNKILPVYDYLDIDNPKSIAPSMDKAIEKVITVATIHEEGNYVDDCYVLMGKAQYLKQDYAAAEETFQFFEEEFDPKNPYGREYTRSKYKKKSVKENRKELKEKKKEAEKEREEKDKDRAAKRKEEQKAREAEQKARKKKAKERRKKGRSRTTKSSDEKKTKRLTKEEREEARAKEKAEEQKKAEEEKYAKEKEKLKEQEAEKKEKESRPQGEGGIWKNKTSFFDGLYWLARTYIETERFSSAKNILERLETTDPLASEVQKQLPAVRAHLYMRTGEMDQALVALDEAIEKESNRSLKARYAFIKAQIYEKDGNTNLAYTEYTKAKKFSPEYEMKFNASLNELKLSYKTGQITKDKALSKLDRMSKEAKNEEFLDQLYFTTAQVKLDAGDVDGAIADFNEAISSSGGNKNIKLEAYYKLAELLYGQAYYREAKNNYDATVKIMPLTDVRYKSVKRLSEGLTDVAKNIDIIELQDSLMRLSRMSEDELRDIAIRDIEARKAAGLDEESGAQRTKNVFASGTNRSLGRSNFFAYNPIALNQGKTEFKKLWKDRSLEDNWRRSLRTDASISESTGLPDEEEEEEVVSEQDIKDYLRNVPTSEVQKRAADLKIQNALFDLGILFRERLRNYEKSVSTLERLIREYPDFPKRDEALFYLYLSYQDLNDNTNATLVKNKLKTEYPESQFTKLATDPSYANAMKQNETNIDAYYDRTYKLFENGKYQAVIERANEKANLFKDDNKYDAKFDLLIAMSNGSLEGKERYIKDLEALIRRHKNTPEEVRAKEILRFLKGDTEAFNEILYEEGRDNFSVDENVLHYAFVVVYDKDEKELQDIKIAISDYNKKYHRMDNLKISNISLNPESKSQIILIRSFPKKAPAMDYYKGILQNEKEFSTRGNEESAKKVQFDMFLTTQKNYREIVKQRSTQKYRTFFEEHYKI